MRVKLTKLQSLPLKEAKVPESALRYGIGHIQEGEFMGSPLVGHSFWVGNHWATSKVTKILSDNTFRTENSVYRWELLPNK